jgi:hypothetical protein
MALGYVQEIDANIIAQLDRVRATLFRIVS